MALPLRESPLPESTCQKNNGERPLPKRERLLPARALGDLYVRTDRLREAEQSYQRALPIYQQIEARLGEANTLQGLGRLASAHGDTPSGFNFYLKALKLQRSIHDLLGEAGSYGYLARTAWAANRPERAVALGERAWKKLRDVQSVWGQFLASIDLGECFEALEEEDGRRSSMILAWYLARSMEEPSAEQRRDLLRQILPDFNPEVEPLEEWLPGVEATLTGVLQRYEKVLAERGEDPLSPLEAQPREAGSSASEGGAIT